MSLEALEPKSGAEPQAASQAKGGETFSLPPDALIILPLRTTVIFPGTVVPLTAGRPGSVRALDEAVRREVPIGVIAQRDPTVDEPGPADLYGVGTAAEVQRLLTALDGQRMVVARGRQRFQVIEYLQEKPFLAVRVTLVDEKARRS